MPASPRSRLLGGRGEITDAEGAPLATSVERYEISVNQRLVANFKGSENPAVPDGAAGVAATLAPMLDMNAAELGGMLVGDRQFVYIRKGVLPQVAREVRKLGLSGVNVDRVAERVYPNNSLAGNVVGFVNSNGVGLAGLEASLDDRLTGTAGSETYERGRKGQAIPGGYSQDTPATQGDSVQPRCCPTCSGRRSRRSTRRSRPPARRPARSSSWTPGRGRSTRSPTRGPWTRTTPARRRARCPCPAGQTTCQNQDPLPAGDGWALASSSWSTQEARKPQPPGGPTKVPLPAACEAILRQSEMS